MNALAVSRDGAGMRLAGELGFGTPAAAWRAAGEQLARAGGDGDVLVVDLSGLAPADSATLAMLLAFAAHARRAGRRVDYVGIPPSLDALARLADARGFLVGES